ncbi:MAG: hypothetical protein ACI9F9_000376 [Candidatus Paceibacteria bacterium]
MADEIETVIKSLYWHSQVTIEFVPDGEGANWGRPKRTITVSSEYVQRFLPQESSARR